MSRHGQKTHADAGLSGAIDSFTDVISNAAGLLTLLLLFAALYAGGRLAGLPGRDATAGKRMHTFEARGEGVYYVDQAALARAATEAVAKVKGLEEEARLDALLAARIAHGHYKVLPDRLLAGSVCVAWAGTTEATDDGQTAPDPLREFRQVLARLDPRRDAVMMVVRIEGLDLFQEARKAAHRLGFALASDIRDGASPMTFGFGARD